MSRIDVVSAEKGKFKVLINYTQEGSAYSSEALAYQEAEKIHASRPHLILTPKKS